jgi:probable H4MPT-linked C1 transfer pathway protein
VVVSLTAELSDAFRSPKDGVEQITRAVESVLGPRVRVGFVTADGELLSAEAARRESSRVAAANWYATARYIGQFYSTAVLVDIGSTTTDIIPIRDHRPCARGLTDLARIQTGELLYVGIERTPLGYLVHRIPWENQWLTVSGEVFSAVGDAWRVAGWARAAEFYHPPVDGRSWSRDDAARRLAKTVCAPWEKTSWETVRAIAHYVVQVQVTKTRAAIRRVFRLHGLDDGVPVFAVGQGAPIMARFAQAEHIALFRVWAPPSACWSSDALAVYLPALEGSALCARW